MKVVLDTNVLMSGIFWSGAPSKILEHWADGRFHILLSIDIISEYQRVFEILGKKYPNSSQSGNSIISTIIAGSSIVDIKLKNPEQISRDPDDDKFIHCALEGNADFLVSGDRDLLDVNGHAGLKIIKPKSFLDRL